MTRIAKFTAVVSLSAALGLAIGITAAAVIPHGPTRKPPPQTAASSQPSAVSKSPEAAAAPGGCPGNCYYVLEGDQYVLDPSKPNCIATASCSGCASTLGLTAEPRLGTVPRRISVECGTVVE
jgi:hypothetical protein